MLLIYMPPRLGIQHVFNKYLVIQTGSFYSLCLNNSRGSGILLSVILIHFSDIHGLCSGNAHTTLLSNHFTSLHDHTQEVHQCQDRAFPLTPTSTLAQSRVKLFQKTRKALTKIIDPSIPSQISPFERMPQIP